MAFTAVILLAAALSASTPAALASAEEAPKRTLSLTGTAPLKLRRIESPSPPE
jgi:hypothetical protein